VLKTIENYFFEFYQLQPNLKESKGLEQPRLLFQELLEFLELAQRCDILAI